MTGGVIRQLVLSDEYCDDKRSSCVSAALVASLKVVSRVVHFTARGARQTRRRKYRPEDPCRGADDTRERVAKTRPFRLLLLPEGRAKDVTYGGQSVSRSRSDQRRKRIVGTISSSALRPDEWRGGLDSFELDGPSDAGGGADPASPCRRASGSAAAIFGRSDRAPG
jgi:hypothetical protein